MLIDVEKELDRCVAGIGGQLVREIIGSSPNFSNADYLFAEHDTVAELKILSVDQMRKPNIRDKMSEIYREAMDRGKSDVIVYGEAKVSSDHLSAEYARKIGEVYRAPVQGVVKKANKQIRQTKEKLGLPRHSGLLILVNDNHIALEPQHVDWMMRETLKNRNYSSIGSVLYFTANLKARHPDLDTDLLVWIESHRPDMNPCDEVLLKSLRSAWVRRISEITGDPVPAYRLKAEALSELEHDI
ncbi:MAG: hypothetical protein KJO27_02875 [Gammaproteobacteria bacterium]|nr:hypothetical protein [Gammaproteobacteria bacterium]NNL44352.1 hypothetical protein [Woeseiaceae bacterium]